MKFKFTRSPITSISIVAGSVAIIAALVSFSGSGDRHDSGNTADNNAAINAGSSGPGTMVDLKYRLVPEKAYEFSFRREVMGSLKGETVIDVRLGGTLTAHVVAADTDACTMIMTMEVNSQQGVDVKQGGKRKAGDTEHSALVTINTAGRLASIQFPSNMSDPREQDVLRDLIASWLTTLPEEGDTHAEEKSFFKRMMGRLGLSDERGPFRFASSDTQGEYRGLLTYSGFSEKLLRIAMEKKEYVRSAAPIRVEYSRHEVRWNAEEEVFKSKNGEDRLDIGPEGFVVNTKQQYEFELTHVGVSHFSQRDVRAYSILAKSFYNKNIYHADSGADGPSKRQVRPWNEVQAELVKVTAHDSNDDKHRIFNDLCNHIKRHPDRAIEALEMARGYRSDDDRFQMIMGALSYAGTPEIQAELQQFYRNGKTDGPLDESGKLSVIGAFTMMDAELTGDSVRFLNAVYNSSESRLLRDSAALALAAGHKNNSDHDQDSMRKIVNSEWGRAENDERRMVVLDMIGNSGEKSFLPIISDALRSSNDALRSKAAYAGRFIDTDDGSRLLLNIISGGDVVRVKEKAAEALTYHQWRDSYPPVLSSCVRSGASDSLRMQCAETGLKHKEYHDSMVSILRSARSGASQKFGAYIDRVTQ
ncbi:MAG TPA: HEAT repeat domain-containing protein [Spirochaetota bacterium]|nr:HEAT repeat domain-containing protein [Spirochaetota bacterium]